MRALSPFFAFSIGEPDGPGWHELSGASMAAAIPAWVDQHARRGHSRDEIGITLSSALIGPALQAAVVAYVGERRGIDIAPANLAIHRNHAGWFDRVAVLHPCLAVTTSDAAAGHPDVVVLPDLAGLREWLADRIVALADSVLSVMHGCVPLGLRGLWSNIGDMLTEDALWAGREAHLSPAAMDALWEDGVVLLEAVARRAPALLNRPRPFPVHGAHRSTLMQVRGTCCLYFKAPGSAAPDGSLGYCRSCPLITDEERTPGLVAFVDRLP